jgi:hypothetical protein
MKLAGAGHLVQFGWQPGQQRLQVEQTIRGDRVVYAAAG